MLSKKECTKAIALWGNSISKYSKLLKLFKAPCAFHFSAKTVKWISKKNDFKTFNAHLGVYSDQLILIFAPLDKNGAAIKMNKYAFAPFNVLQNDIELLEVDVIHKTTKGHLSQDLSIKDSQVEMSYKGFNEPFLHETEAQAQIRNWKKEGLEWLQYESLEFAGERIVKYFSVPIFDLDPKRDGLNTVVAFLGLRYSQIYNRTIPNLIFVETNDSSSQAKVMKTTVDVNNPEDSNSRDYSKPCPPICGSGGKGDISL